MVEKSRKKNDKYFFLLYMGIQNVKDHLIKSDIEVSVLLAGSKKFDVHIECN